MTDFFTIKGYTFSRKEIWNADQYEIDVAMRRRNIFFSPNASFDDAFNVAKTFLDLWPQRDELSIKFQEFVTNFNSTEFIDYQNEWNKIMSQYLQMVLIYEYTVLHDNSPSTLSVTVENSSVISGPICVSIIYNVETRIIQFNVSGSYCSYPFANMSEMNGVFSLVQKIPMSGFGLLEFIKTLSYMNTHIYLTTIANADYTDSDNESNFDSDFDSDNNISDVCSNNSYMN